MSFYHWIEWHGGKCPVAFGTVVEIVYGDGLLKRDEAQFLDWSHRCEETDINAYRVIDDE